MHSVLVSITTLSNLVLSCKLNFLSSIPLRDLMPFSCSEDFQDVRGSIFQRLGPKWAIALKASLLEWKRVEYSIGCQCMVDESTLIKGKLTSEGYLGIVYQQLFAENIRVMYHFGVPLADPIKGNHKLGISWSFNC